MPSEIVNRIAIPEEQELRERIAAHPLFKDVQALAGVDTDSDYDVVLKDQLRRGTELSARSHASLFELCKTATKKLGLEINVRLFKSREGGGENASVVSRNDDVLVMFQDGILRSLDEDQSLLSVVGHELGHHAFGHTKDVVWRSVADVDSTIASIELLTAATAKELRRLSRDARWDELLMLKSVLGQTQELNADRAGLVCVERFEDSVRGSMVLSGGPADRFGTYDPADYLAQARQLLASGDVFDDDDAFSSHPLEPLRVLALEYFCDSDVYKELTSRGKGDKRLADFSKLLPSIIPLERVRGGRSSRRAKAESAEVAAANAECGAMTAVELCHLTYLCVLNIVAADGKVTPAEQVFLDQQIRPADMAVAVASAMEVIPESDFIAHFDALLEKAKGLGARTKTALVKRMIKAAKADRRVSQEEVDSIRSLATSMGATQQAEREIANVWGR